MRYVWVQCRWRDHRVDGYYLRVYCKGKVLRQVYACIKHTGMHTQTHMQKHAYIHTYIHNGDTWKHEKEAGEEGLQMLRPVLSGPQVRLKQAPGSPPSRARTPHAVGRPPLVCEKVEPSSVSRTENNLSGSKSTNVRGSYLTLSVRAL